MIIRSVQKREVLDSVMSTGVAYCTDVRTMADDPDFPLFSVAYRWMSEQMERRIPSGKPERAQSPFWGWAQYGNSRKVYRMDQKQYSPEEYVLLTLDIPEDQLLLSDFDLWHYPLNGCACTDSRELRKCQGQDFLSLPEDLRNAIMKSWERIFDLRTQDRFQRRKRRNRYIQATFWQIRREWIANND